MTLIQMHRDNLKLAYAAAQESIDPSTKVGSVIMYRDPNASDPFYLKVGQGYNGFPQGVEATEERLNNRDLKYPMTVHAEVNAILDSCVPVEACILYSTHMPCSSCTGIIIQSGIRTVVVPEYIHKNGHWTEDSKISLQMFTEAGVTVVSTILGAKVYIKDGNYCVTDL